MKLRKLALATSLSLIAISSSAFATTYNNMFISYYSPDNVTAMVNYAKTQKLGGLIMWEFQGDTAYGGADSLLSAANKAYNVQPGETIPQIMGYWTDWSIYSSQAIPQAPYPVPGSVGSDSQPAVNADFTGKLAGMNVVDYSFLEAQAKTYTYIDPTTGSPVTVSNPNYAADGGTLYFDDPWADLLPQDKSSFCKDSSNATCWYVDNRRGITPTAGAGVGNFEAFSKLAHASSTNPLGPLKKVFAVGGYGHNDTFEDAFDSPAHIDNFVNSAAAIISAYGMDGIDLDYEDPAMNYTQSNDFLKLVTALRTKLGPDKIIDVTVLSSPDYLKGANNIGFDPTTGDLKAIAARASHINLMTYDFHGAFDYTADGKGKTGFLTNLYMPNDEDAADAKFSVDTSVAAAVAEGVPASEVSIGIPAYGRALTGIASTNGGLFQGIPSAATIPQGNLDTPTCTTGLPLTASSCSGSFSYNYIVQNMLTNGFTATPRTDSASGVSNGVSAYASSWLVPGSDAHKLQVTNTGNSTDGDLAITVTVHAGANSLKTTNVGLGVDQDYTGMTIPSTAKLSGSTGLTVDWMATYTPTAKGTCSGTFDFTQDEHVMVKVNGQGVGVCSFAALPSKANA